jgi:spore coat polysaccharide biosynthesis protein SpsF
MIYWQLNRISQSNVVDEIIVATSNEASDDSLAEYVESLGFRVIRHSLNDVYSRYIFAIESCKLKSSFIRLTADCPLVMPELIDKIYPIYLRNNADYVSNTLRPTYPDGLDIEIVNIEAFKNLQLNGLSGSEREHVTYGFHSRTDLYNCVNIINESDLSHMRLTVDYIEDFEFVSEIYAHFWGRETEFNYSELIYLLDSSETLKSLMPLRTRNEVLGPNIGIAEGLNEASL